MTNLQQWIHIFTVTDTQKHKGGYTIYKITSVVFPRSVPEALTCLTVWKRFHDVKRLYRELSRRNKSLQIGVELPEPTDASFFKRFDSDVIQRRKKYILELLDYAAQHPALYKCHAFAQFFSGAEQFGGISPTLASPLHGLHLNGRGGAKETNGVIAGICDKSEKCNDNSDNKKVFQLERDKQLNNNENSITTANEHSEEENQNESARDEMVPEKVENCNTEEETVYDVKPCKDYTRFLTPMASIESDDSDYIYEAALEFSHAVQAEANLEYQEAYTRYKRGVELLLNGSKDDGNDDRKFIAKAKISKYLARADDIHDKFLRNDNPYSPNAAKINFQLSIDVSDCVHDATAALYLERPWNNLAKYKVLRVLGERVMQVQCITEPQRPMYVMKGIEKPSSNSPTQSVFLPQHVPYMVDLLAFFQSDQKIFLLLKQAEGGRLYDYLQTYSPTAIRATDLDKLFPEISQTEKVSNEDVCEDVEVGMEAVSDTPILTPPNDSTDFSELVRCSQQLLESVSNTLKQVEEAEVSTSTQQAEIINPAVGIVRVPEVSLKQWARELAVAIHSLHGKGVILSDLNMDNLLLGAKGQLLLTYFYQNECLDSANDDCYAHKSLSWNALAGHFVAPERPLTNKSDWWSYGVILYQLLLGLSFKSAHPGRIDFYFSVQYPEHVDITEQARNLLDNLLLVAPEERFGYDQLQRHEFFCDTNWQEVQCNGLNPAMPMNISGIGGSMPLKQQHATN